MLTQDKKECLVSLETIEGSKIQIKLASCLVLGMGNGQILFVGKSFDFPIPNRLPAYGK